MHVVKLQEQYQEYNIYYQPVGLMFGCVRVTNYKKWNEHLNNLNLVDTSNNLGIYHWTCME